MTEGSSRPVNWPLGTAVLDAISDPICLLDTQGTIIDCNRAMAELQGRPADELVGQPCWEAVHGTPEAIEPRPLRRMWQSGRRESTRLPVGDRWFEVTVDPLRDEEGNLVAAVHIMSDVTERVQTEEDLKHALAWQEAIFEGSRDAIFITDADSRLTAVNLAACELTGYSREELLEMRIPDLHEEPDLHAYRLYHDRIMAGEETLSEAKILRKDGRHVDTEFNNRRIIIAGMPYMHTTAHDVTERRRADEALRQRAEELAALNALGRRISLASSLDQLVDEATQGIAQAIQADLALIFLQAGERLILKGLGPALPGLPRAAPRGCSTTGCHQGGLDHNHDRPGAIPEHPVQRGLDRVGECLCGLAVREGRPLYSRDILTDARCTWRECRQAGVRSFAALPLRSGQEIIGLVGLGTAAERDWEPMAEFLETLASQVAAGVRNAVLYEQVERRLTELTAVHQTGQCLRSLQPPEQLAQEIIQVLEKVVGYDYGAVLLVEEETGRLVPFALSTQGRDLEFVRADKEYVAVHAPRLGEGITGWVAQTGQSVRLGDVSLDPRYHPLRENVCSELCVPLNVGDTVIGVVNVEATRPYAYTETDQSVLETVAAQIGIAIRNARLLEQVQRQAADLEARVQERTADLQARVSEVERLNRAMVNLVQDLQASHHLLQRTAQSLQSANDLITALGRVTARLKTSLTPDHVFQALGAELGQLDLTCVVALWEPDAQALAIRYLSAQAPEMAQIERLVGQPALGFRLSRQRLAPYTDAIETGRSVFEPDPISLAAAALPLLPRPVVERLLPLAGLDSQSRLIYLPMKVSGRELGVIAVWGRGLQETDLPAFSIFAGQVAAALEVARAHQQLKAERVHEQAVLLHLSQSLLGETAPQAVMDRAVTVAAGALGTEFAALSLVDEDGRHYSDAARFGWGTSGTELAQGRVLSEAERPVLSEAERPVLSEAERPVLSQIPLDTNTDVGRAILSQTPVFVSAPALVSGPSFVVDAGIRASLIAPLLVAGKSLGALVVDSRETRQWTEDEVRLLALMANMTAQALERARLLAAERRRRQEAENLRQVSAVLTASLEPDQVVNQILDLLQRVVPYDSSAVFLYEGDGLRLAASRGLLQEDQVIGQLFPADTCLFEESQHTYQPLILADAQCDPRFARWGGTDYVRGWMGVPLIVQNQVIGHLTLDSRRVGAYDERDAALAQAFANQAAVAVQNARLFEQVRTGRERLGHLSRQLVEVQENERRALARDLHDQVGQALSAVKIHLQALGRPSTAALLRENLQVSLIAVERSLQTVRTLSRGLRPAVLDDLGLVPALRWHLDSQAQSAGYTGVLSADSFETRLPAEMETACFRIAQEALTNVARHATAHRVEVRLQAQARSLDQAQARSLDQAQARSLDQAQARSLDPAGDAGEVLLVIRDDGAGFDVPAAVADAAQGASLGLLSMQERAELAGGRLEILSAPGQGTEVRVYLPLSRPS